MPSTFIDLPAELIEAVLVLSAASDPGSIAALSQTSRFFHDLIYRCPDQHLWRETFLAIFDDPRPVLSCLSTISGGHPSFDAHNFDWTKEYVRRISAARYIRHPLPVLPFKAPARTCIVYSMEDLIDIPPLLSVVQSLLSVIETSIPFPSSPTISLTILTDPSSQEEASSPFAPMINSPPFPPLLLLLAANYNSVLTSLNATWLNDLLEFGFPPELTRILFATLSVNVLGRPPFHPGLTPAAIWGESEVGHLFHKLVCCTGFVPIPTLPSLVEAESSPEAPADMPLPTTWTEAQSALSSAPPGPVSVTKDKMHPDSSPDIQRPQSSFYSAEEQFADARRLARRRVYDMQYLNSARMWGPFRPVRRGGLDTSTSLHGGEDGDDDDDEYDDDDDEDGLRLTWTNRGLKVTPPIAPYELVPDYVWLASARIVVEANLREAFERSEDPSALSTGDIMPLMHKMHTIRVGGSPGFWNGWVNRPGSMNEVEGSRMDDKSKEGEGVEGWDWAGVTGIWK